MQRNIFILSFLLIITGCTKENDDDVLLRTDFVTIVKDSIQYGFGVPGASFGVQDTLDAYLTIYNSSHSTDTLILPDSGIFYSTWSTDTTVILPSSGLAFLGSWILKNSNGHTVMYGPKSMPQNLMKVPLRAHQTFGGLVIHQAFKDTLGVSLPAGSYTLEENIDSLSFPIPISLR
jgi:hypothetical protein